MARTFIQPEGALQPPNPRAHAVRKGNIIQVAGQVGLDLRTYERVGTTVAEQTTQILGNIETILTTAGATLQDVVMFRVYLTDTAHFAELNAAYAEFLGNELPARTTVYVGLPAGFLVEIDALAVLG